MSATTVTTSLNSNRVKLPSIAELTAFASAKPSPDSLPLSSRASSSIQPHNSPAPPYMPYGQSRFVTAPPAIGYTASVPWPLHGHSYYYENVPVVCPPGPVPMYPYVYRAEVPQREVTEIINKPMNECHRCGTTETPEWRRGPNGLRTLCNACGLYHAKLVKRKGAALAAEEVLNNKVCKGKNGRRISIKKQALHTSRVTEFPVLPPVGYSRHTFPHQDL